MSDYVILTDATADHVEEITDQYPFIDIIPMTLTIGGREYTYGGTNSTITCREFYNLQRDHNYGHTSLISPGVYSRYFEKYLSQDKDIIYLCFSSGMSDTYRTACMIAEELENLYPGRSITCIDTLNGSTPEGFLVHEAAVRKSEGMCRSELTDWIEKNKLKIGVYFSVNNLDHLVHGGRMSRASAAVGNALRIKPFLTIGRDGKLYAAGSPIGMNRAVRMLVEKMEEEWNPGQSSYVLICHGDDEPLAENLKNRIKERFPEADVETGLVDPIIGVHTGPGMISLCFWSDERKQN